MGSAARKMEGGESAAAGSGMVRAQKILEEVFGYRGFRSHQAGIIEALIAGRDVLALMPTGGGKSLCYQIPALVREGTGVVVSPLIALMQDQVDALRELDVSAAFLNSSQSLPEQRKVEAQLMAGELDLLYVAPERLVGERMLGLLHAARIALFALDEAHCVSQWGHDFRLEYRQLSILADHFPHVPRIALTATADARTRQEIIEQLTLASAAQFVASFDRPNIRYMIHDGSGGKSRDRLWRFIRDEHPADAGIVYCLRRRDVEEVAELLAAKGRVALPYHAGLDGDQRRINQQRFLREEGVIVVATIAFGMGIDKPDVRFVAHLNLPKSVEAYYQETGRAGRDGEPASAWMIHGLQDVITYKQWITESQAGEQQKRIEQHKLDALIGLCEVTSCRRSLLLGYFGETFAGPCGNCDNCLNPPESKDMTEAARMALSAAYRTGERFGVNYLIDVLLARPEPRIAQNGHDKLSVHGIGKGLSEGEWRAVFRQLLSQGMLLADVERHGSLLLTSTCRSLLRGEARFLVRAERARAKLDGKPVKERKSREPAVRVAPGDQALWEALRALRLALAAKGGVPPYVIFHDRTLNELVARRPCTLAELEGTIGLGTSKIGRFGQAIVETIAGHGKPALLDNKLSVTVNKTLELHLQGLEPAAIAEARKIEVATVLGHFAEAIEAGLLELAAAVRLEPAEIDEISGAFERLGTLDSGKIGPVFAALEERYDYGTLKCVLAALV